ICFLFAALAEYAGVATIIGAYIAGIAIGFTPYKKEISSEVDTISYSLFTPIFFASIGLTVDLSGLQHQWQLIVVFSLVAILSKLIGGALGAKASGFYWSQSMGIGAAMVSRGEVALIIAGLGLNASLITESLFS